MRRFLALGAVAALALASCRREAPPQTDPRPAAAIRYAVGGDSRQDTAHVVPWAFGEAKAKGVSALIYLGDMELKPDMDDHFRDELAGLSPVPFYPVLGNHESVRRPYAADAPHDDRVRALSAFRTRFLGKPGTPVQSAFDDKLVYSVDLPGGLHFVALDNVSQPGFGADQIAWLTADLDRAVGRDGEPSRGSPNPSGKAKHIVVGMHKPLAGGGITNHSMDEDGPGAAADSAAALALFQKAKVELLFASHYHGYADYVQGGIRSFITGGMGAPLDAGHGKEGSFHHFLLVAVPPDAPLAVEVVRFPGAPAIEAGEER